jgi:hypothetical protein
LLAWPKLGRFPKTAWTRPARCLSAWQVDVPGSAQQPPTDRFGDGKLQECRLTPPARSIYVGRNGTSPRQRLHCGSRCIAAALVAPASAIRGRARMAMA